MTPGTRLGRYTLHALVGEGGMGAVYRATLHGPAGFEKQVALKVLRGGGEGLIREARLGGLLQHPHLVEVYALEQVEGQWVCAMEYVGGGSLEGRVLAPRAVVEVGLHVASGLEHAHAEIGLVHLDLKPANLLLSHGLVKVADLGISTARGFRADGAVRGTPAYMAPEHLAGQPTDARADVFALGVVLGELATGVRSRDPEQVSWLAPILRRCLVADPNQRFASMAELGDALRTLPAEGEGLAGRAAILPPPAATRGTDTFALDLAGPAPSKTNLTAIDAPLHGRESDVEAVLARLERAALVTIRGPAGVGKTRLAQEVGERWHRQARGEAWFVDLSAARTRDEVLTALSAVFGLPLGPGASGEERLTELLAEREGALLLLDNFEQLVDLGPLVDGWTRAAPGVRWLITSRTPLRVAAEQVHELGLLELDAAVELLVQGAAARGRDVRGDPDLAELAKELDRLPLALELAASRLGTLTPRRVLDRMQQRFRLLASRDPERDRRHATLEAALDWSWELLEPEEQAALAQLSVFPSAFELEAAEAVLALPDGAWALDAVESLVERSLVTSVGERLDLLVTVRAYGARRLREDAEDVTRAQRAHAEHYALRGAPGALARLRGEDAVLALQQLRDERAHLETALERSLDHGWSTAVPVLAALAEIVEVAGPPEPLARAAERTLDLASTADQRARVLEIAGRAWSRAGDAERAEQRLRAGLAEAPEERVPSLSHALGSLHRLQGRYAEAEAAYRVALGGDAHVQGLAHNGLAMVAKERGELAAAETHYRESLARHRVAGDLVGEAVILGNLGALELDMGAFAAARRHLGRALDRHRRTNNRISEAFTLGNLATLFHEEGRLDEAREGYAAALAGHRRVGNRGSAAIVGLNLGMLELLEGQLEAARSQFEQARVRCEQLGRRGLLGIAHGQLAAVHREAGRIPEARRELDTALALVREVGDRRFEGVYCADRAWLDALDGQLEASARGLADAERILDEVGATVELAKVVCRRAMVATRSGEDPSPWLDRATAMAAELGLDEASELGRLLAEARAST